MRSFCACLLLLFQCSYLDNDQKMKKESREDDLTRDAYLAVCAKLEDPGSPQNLSAIICAVLVCDQFDCN
ncbi:hypothetical protein EHQ52_11250 [Leptospira koniambonensis]|uniref:Uncharacterized protein n=1 Tax=Leptospira koniambonensis TaxID=2484950 RepID=A0A4R9J8S5_9LEPT|nr:hypothetical protein [Leptospira koniambonensis]TGL35050.1 hypothetical protein EHQ52_11250 [Leptospira koniambonensis]